MTPHLTYHAVVALSRRRNLTAWYHAALNRVKTLPKLEEIIHDQPHKRDVGLSFKNALMNRPSGKAK